MLIEKIRYPYPDQVNMRRSDSTATSSSGYASIQQQQLQIQYSQASQASSHSSTNDTKILQSIIENVSGSKSPEEPPSNRTPSSNNSPLNTGLHEPLTNMKPVHEETTREWRSGIERTPELQSYAESRSGDSGSFSTLVEQPTHSIPRDSSGIHITLTNDGNSSTATSATSTEENRVAPPTQLGLNHPQSR